MIFTILNETEDNEKIPQLLQKNIPSMELN